MMRHCGRYGAMVIRPMQKHQYRAPAPESAFDPVERNTGRRFWPTIEQEGQLDRDPGKSAGFAGQGNAKIDPQGLFHPLFQDAEQRSAFVNQSRAMEE